MKYVEAGIIILVLLIISVTVSGQRPKPSLAKEKLREFMRQKLTVSQAVLEGITTNKLDKVTHNGQALRLLSLEDGWRVLQTEEYVEQTRRFREVADRLVVAGRKANLDAAALAYVDMTLHCVECHRYVRARKGLDEEAIQ